MATLTLQIPDDLEKEHDETVRLIAAKLYEAGKLTLGQAAEMCGMEKWDFPAVLAGFNVSYFQYTAEDVIAGVEKMTIRDRILNFRASGPSSFGDAQAWEREEREDRDLPFSS